MEQANQHQAARLLAAADSDAIRIISHSRTSGDLDGGDLATLVTYTNEIEAVETPNDKLIIETEKYGIDLELKYARDGRAYLTSETGKSLSELQALSNQERGNLVEDHIVPDLMKDRGYEKADGFEKDGSNEIGIDYIGYDEEANQYVLVEAKFTSQFEDENIGTGILDEGYGYKQMSDDWIRNALDAMVEEGIIDPELANKVRTDVLSEDKEVKKVLTVVKNTEEDGRTITSNLASKSLNFDHVDIVQIGRVIE